MRNSKDCDQAVKICRFATVIKRLISHAALYLSMESNWTKDPAWVESTKKKKKKKKKKRLKLEKKKIQIGGSIWKYRAKKNEKQNGKKKEKERLDLFFF